VIDRINAGVVPVWIDVRREPMPARPWVAPLLLNAQLDAEGRVVDAFSQGFFLREAVLTPDGETLLNPAGDTVTASIGRFAIDGAFSYAEMDAGDFLVMFDRALARFTESMHARNDMHASNQSDSRIQARER
jgi:hypothetical protein